MWEVCIKMVDKFPSITKDNIDTWNSITYGWIINGMINADPDLKYGEAMTRANDITNLLFDALRKKMGVTKSTYWSFE